PLHAARGEGPRVPARDDDRRRGGHPAAPRGDRQRRRRRGAAPHVRGRHARAAHAARDVLPRPQARRRAHRRGAVTLPGGAFAGGFALQRRAAAGRRGGAREGAGDRAAARAQGAGGATLTAVSATLQRATKEPLHGTTATKRPPGHRAAFAFGDDAVMAIRYLAAATM